MLERYESGMAAVVFDLDGKIIAYTALFTTAFPNIYELGKVWVDKDFRGPLDDDRKNKVQDIEAYQNWLVYAVLDYCNSILRELRGSGHVFTSSSRIIHHLKSHGWTDRGRVFHLGRKERLRGIAFSELRAGQKNGFKTCSWLYVVYQKSSDPLLNLYQ
ncbi:hypothetical protein CL632_02380 [bacterium]|nr:hypothetical protein [bacterium]